MVLALRAVLEAVAVLAGEFSTRSYNPGQSNFPLQVITRAWGIREEINGRFFMANMHTNREVQLRRNVYGSSAPIV